MVTFHLTVVLKLYVLEVVNLSAALKVTTKPRAP